MAEGAPLPALRQQVLESLARRVETLPPGPLRTALEARWQEAGAAGASHAGGRSAHGEPPSAGIEALVALNRQLRGTDAGHPGSRSGSTSGAQLAGSAATRELGSARRFGATWARIAAEQQVERAARHAPPNPGPLNAHTLVLESMAWMRRLSPDYLRAFLGQADTLLALDDLPSPREPRAAAPAPRKAARRAKR